MKVHISICIASLLLVGVTEAADRNVSRVEPDKQSVVRPETVAVSSPERTPANLQLEADDLSVNWSVIGGGGGVLTSGTLTVSGTIGQTAVGTVASGTNTVHAGFWQVFDDLSCCEIRGNVDHMQIGENPITIADLTYLVSMVFRGGPQAPCLTEADVTADGSVNIADITYLVGYLFRGGSEPPPCS